MDRTRVDDLRAATPLGPLSCQPYGIGDLLSRLRCWLEDGSDVIDCVELPGGDGDH